MNGMRQHNKLESDEGWLHGGNVAPWSRSTPPPPGRRDRVSQSPNDGLAAETDDDALGVASWPRPPL